MTVVLNPNALTSLANVKSHLGVPTGVITDDDRLSLFINAASDRIAKWCDRIFFQQDYTEYHSGRRQNFLLPLQYPITAISELRVSNQRTWTDPQSIIDPTQYTLSDFNSTIQYDGIFPGGVENIRVIYTAGYSVIPSDLELCCMWHVEWYYKHRAAGDMGRTSKSKGDESVGILAVTPPMIKEIMLDYQRCEFQNSESPVRNA